MQRKHLAVLPLALAAALGSSAFARDITFKGTVQSVTCVPHVEGGGEDGTVVLPPITQRMFPRVDDTAGTKTFSIDLTNCTEEKGKKIKAYFWQPSAQNGRLSKSSGSGSGWSYELLTADDNVLAVGTSGSALPSSSADQGVSVDTNGTAKLTYKVRYHRDAQNVVGGDMDAVATYVLYVD